MRGGGGRCSERRVDKCDASAVDRGKEIMGAWDRSQVKLGSSLVRCHIYLADKSILGHRISAYHLRIHGACCVPINVTYHY